RPECALHLAQDTEGLLVLGVLRQAAERGPRGRHARLRLRPVRRGLLPPHRLRLTRADGRSHRADQDASLALAMRVPLSRDPAWLSFAEAVKPEFARCTFQEALITACGGAEDIAWAVFFHHGAGSLEWLDGEIPFLRGARPRELIKRGRGDRVRECLWK